MLSPKENDIQSDLYYITKKRTTSCFIDTLHFRILPAHLWMTAFANSHHPVLRQCNAAIISAVRICGNLLCQFIRMLFLFSVYRILTLNDVLFVCQVDIRLFLRSVVLYHLCDATTPRGWTAAFGCWPARSSRSWGKGVGRENTLRV